MKRKSTVWLLPCVAIFLQPIPAHVQSAPNGLAVLDGTAWHRMQASREFNPLAIQLTLLNFRDSPALLDQKGMMQCFILMNNRESPNFLKANTAIYNELDYPDLAQFYKSHASEILKSIPSTFAFRMGRLKQAVDGFTSPTAQDIYLGEYDTSRGAFPFLTTKGKNSILIVDGASFQETQYCHTGSFDISIDPIKISELRMSKADAKEYLDRAGAAATFQRDVNLRIEAEIIPGTFESVAATPYTVHRVTLKAKVNKITAFAGQKELGVVYPPPAS